MPKIGEAEFKGISGKSYRFYIYPIGTSFKDLPIVYIVSKRYENEESRYKHKVVYVGETENAAERFNGHHKQECFESHDANCICIRQEADEESRLAAERDLIANYGPACND